MRSGPNRLPVPACYKRGRPLPQETRMTFRLGLCTAALVLFLPLATCLSDRQIEAILAFARDGGGRSTVRGTNPWDYRPLRMTSPACRSRA